MTYFIHEKRHLPEVLLFLFNIKKTSAESCRMLVEAYGHNAKFKGTCSLEDLRTTILTWKTRNAKERQKIRRRGFGSDTR